MIFANVILVYISIISTLIFISFLLLIWGLVLLLLISWGIKLGSFQFFLFYLLSAFMAKNLPLSSAFVALCEFDILGFHFYLFQDILISFLKHWWFRSMLFISTYWWVFQPSSCYWFLFSYDWVLEKMLSYDFNILIFYKTWFVIYHVIYPGEYSICNWKEFVFCYCWMDILQMYVSSVWSEVWYNSSVFSLVFCLEGLFWEVIFWRSLLLFCCCLFVLSDWLLFVWLIWAYNFWLKFFFFPLI